MVFWYAFLSVFIVSLISLVGAVFIVLQRKFIDSLTTYLLALSSGILLGATFYDLVPEGSAGIGNSVYTWLIVGIVAFFILEKFIHWHSHVEGEKPSKIHLAYLTLVGDGVHNFLDGAVIGVTFLTSVPLGVVTTLAVIAHEIPHEMSDFFLLIYGGFDNKRALWFNFLSALTAILGTITVFVFSRNIVQFSPYFIGFAAGNFLYIAASDLIPELHEKHNVRVSVMQTIFLIAGVILMQGVSTHLKG